MMAGQFKRIVVLTGAGISAESGLDTFRDKDGLWTRVDMEQVATPQGFARDPAYVHDFHNMLRRNLPQAQPNEAHRALAELERAWPGEMLVVTQNVDDLHERAGSRNLIHMHGEMQKARCEDCGDVFRWTGDLSVESPCPACRRAGHVRPHVVWFYEEPLRMDEIGAALRACDLFVSIGTSGNVYPAAGFVADVRFAGRAHTVELNLEPSEGSSLFHECRQGPATGQVPAYVRELLGQA